MVSFLTFKQYTTIPYTRASQEQAKSNLENNQCANSSSGGGSGGGIHSSSSNVGHINGLVPIAELMIHLDLINDTYYSSTLSQ